MTWLGLSFHKNGNAISISFSPDNVFLFCFVLFAETKRENGYVSNYGPHCLGKFMQTTWELIQSELLPHVKSSRLHNLKKNKRKNSVKSDHHWVVLNFICVQKYPDLSYQN